MKHKFIIVFTILTGIFSYSQHHEEAKHRIAFVLGHSYVSLDNNDILSIPTFGLDYEYWLSNHWGIGIFSDVELITKELSPSVEGKSIERECPLVLTLDVLWNPVEHWEFVLGPGIVSEKGEIESLVRMGVEYDMQLGHHWDVAPNFSMIRNLMGIMLYPLVLVLVLEKVFKSGNNRFNPLEELK